MGSLGLSAAVLRWLAGADGAPAGFVGWCDGRGGAWRYDRAIWIRERCDFEDEAIVYVSRCAASAEAGWEARLATPAERAAFLGPLPAWHGIVVGRTAGGLPVAATDGHEARQTRVLRGGIHARLFEQVLGRVAHGEVLAQSIKGSALAAELRSHFERGFDLSRRIRGASVVHRRAFELARQIGPAPFADSLSVRIDTAVAGAGARVVDWRPLPEHEVSIVWTPLAGPLTNALIETRACALTLGLLSAGICVSGADAAFDVASLCSAVVRQPWTSAHQPDGNRSIALQ